MAKPKHVVVLAHADGWGALSANIMLRHLHDHYPDLRVSFIVSQATKNSKGEIATKLGDLKLPRKIRETDMLTYFDRIDKLAGDQPVEIDPRYGRYTFKELGRRFSEDGMVHYTTCGGHSGGEEVAAIVQDLQVQRGIDPEIFLSLDTMAILPAHITDNYPCFSLHPGPLGTIVINGKRVKVEGMQGTLRSEVNNIFTFPYGPGVPCVQGTMFLQHSELDKGPPISHVDSPAPVGMCAYQIRNELYALLVQEMIGRLPELLDPQRRSALIKKALAAKTKLDAEPTVHIGNLEADQLMRWQNQAIGYPDEDAPHGLHVIHNLLLNPKYFLHEMRHYLPVWLDDAPGFFEGLAVGIFGEDLRALTHQSEDRLTDHWARYHAGLPVKIIQYDPQTLKPIAVYENPAPEN